MKSKVLKKVKRFVGKEKGFKILKEVVGFVSFCCVLSIMYACGTASDDEGGAGCRAGPAQ